MPFPFLLRALRVSVHSVLKALTFPRRRASRRMPESFVDEGGELGDRGAFGVQ